MATVTIEFETDAADEALIKEALEWSVQRNSNNPNNPVNLTGAEILEAMRKLSIKSIQDKVNGALRDKFIVEAIASAGTLNLV